MREPASAAFEAVARRGALAEARLEHEARRGIVDASERLLAIAEERQLVERVAEAALANGTVERLVERLLESQLAADIAAQVADSEPLRSVVDSVARSPEVRKALQAQSTGLANEVAGQVRGRTARVDDALEHAARRLTRRGNGRDPVVRVTVEDEP